MKDVSALNEQKKKDVMVEYMKAAFVVGLAHLLFMESAWAAPLIVGWEKPLCGLSQALTGTTAIGVATIAFGAAAVGFVFGEQLQGIMKSMVNVVIGTGLLLGATTVVNGIANMMGVTSVCT